MRKFRFAVQARTASGFAEWRAKAVRAEELGYSAFLVPDHVGGQFAPLVAMTAAAAATTSIKIGSQVFNNDLRNPVQLASEIATLDQLSEGRVEFGIGAGWKNADYHATGIGRDSGGTRIDRLSDSVRIIKALWRNEPLSDSDHYAIEQSLGQEFPQPHSEPHPPVMIGGGGRQVLSVAANEADIVGVNGSLASGVYDEKFALSNSPQRFAERVEWIKDAAGSRFDQLELQILVIVGVVLPDRDAMISNLATQTGLSEEEVRESPVFLVGTEDEICAQLEAHRAKYGVSYWVVLDSSMEMFAPIVSKLSGH